MALTDDEVELYKVAKAALPNNGADVPDELLAGAAKALQPARAQIAAWRDAHLILRATSNDLDVLARDRGAARQSGESDAALAARLRQVDPAITPNALLAAAQAVVDGSGVVGTVALVQLRGDMAHFCTDAASGHKVAYLSRGYRLGHVGRPHVCIFILPYGTTAATAAAVQVLLNRKAGAGIVVRTETRGVP